MARAFLASIPLAVVLVAALVVPLAVTPGTFGFHSWPTAHSAQVTERAVSQAPRSIEVAPTRSGDGTARRRGNFVDAPATRPRSSAAAKGDSASAAPAPARHSAELVQGPSAAQDGRRGSASGPGDAHASAPAVPAAPSTPASGDEAAQSQQPAPEPQQVAADPAPVLRDSKQPGDPRAAPRLTHRTGRRRAARAQPARTCP